MQPLIGLTMYGRIERPVPMEAVRECLSLALQAPTGSNAQGWHFLLVTQAEKRRALARQKQRDEDNRKSIGKLIEKHWDRAAKGLAKASQLVSIERRLDDIERRLKKIESLLKKLSKAVLDRRIQ